MPTARSTPPWWVFLLATAFFAYFGLLAYCDILRPEDYGYTADFTSGRMVLSEISDSAASPAVRAGLRTGDVIVQAGGKPIRSMSDWTVIDENVQLDRPIDLVISRDGALLNTTLTLRRAKWSYWPTEPGIILLGVLAAQVVALALAFVIVLKRPYDGVALLGAWSLATIGVYTIVPPYRLAAIWRDLPSIIGALLFAPYACSTAVGAVLFTFFVSFPRRMFDKRLVWLALWTPMLIALVQPMRYLVLAVYRPDLASFPSDGGRVLVATTVAYTIAGLGALVVNYRRLEDLNERRRIKMLVIGAVAGLVPGLLVVASYRLRSHANLAQSIFASRSTSLGTLTILLFPASFAYAILRHRLFDVSVMIRQGVRYALARRMLVSVVPALALLLVIDVLLRGDQPLATTLAARGSIYLAIGGLAVVAHRLRQPWLRSLDRRFFREQYDAQQILRRVAEDIRQVGDFSTVAPRVVAQIEAALHPEFVALMVRPPNDVHYRLLVSTPAGLAPPPLRVDSKLIALLRVLGKPLEVSSGSVDWLAQQLPEDELQLLKQAHIDLLVPIVTNPDHSESVLALGIKRSEEPYSRDDTDLLVIIASNLALLLERPVAHVKRTQQTFEECPQCGTCFDAGTGTCTGDGAALAPIRLPRVLANRYQLDRRLGRGGFGTVYAAFDTALDRRVAVKMIRDDLLANPDIARRFQREARLAAAFVHPNVVTIYDFGATSEARAFLVMELLDGATLRDELRQQTRFPPARALSVMRDVCAAMEAAHRRQLVHRDLKPENIFLVTDGSKETAKILDFGVAKVLNAARDVISDAGVLLGTLSYMAPAQLRGEDVQPSWDMWALAVITYEMLTGAHPFAHCAVGAGTLPLGVSDAIARPLADAPASWKLFFTRALALEPGAAPPSPARFLIELERALSWPTRDGVTSAR